MTASADKALRLLHDRALAERAHRGDVTAFHELRRRHAAACWRLALVVTRSTGSASEAVRSAFASVLAHPERTPSSLGAPLRSQLLAATRDAAITTPVEASTPAPTDDPFPVDPGVPVAFHQLPELWRSVLWLTDVEELPRSEVARVLDLADEGVDKLLGRARDGIHEQLTHEQAAGLPADCQRTTTQLAAYAADELAPRVAARVRRHLDACAGCRARLEELDDVHPGLRRSLVALPVLLVGDLEAAWAERTIAGAAAAVIAVGITGAILSGRGKGREDLVRETSTEQRFGADDGEVALGGGDPSTESGGTHTDATGGATEPTAPLDPTTAAPTGAAGGTATPGEAAGGDTPRGSTPAPAPSPAPSAPAPSTPGPAPSSPPTTQGPALQVTVGLDDTLGVSIGDGCTDLTVLGTPLAGCGGQEPGGIEVGGSILPPIKLGL